MNYHHYYPIDVVNGEGTRCTLFVSGCEHKCKGCHNAKTWRADSGRLFDEAAEQRIIDDLQDKRVFRDGLSLSGGDPLFPANIDGILRLVKRVKRECPEKTIWLWTGYVVEHMTAQQREIIACVDVVIDGKYVASKKDPTLIWRGSSNQRIWKEERI